MKTSAVRIHRHGGPEVLQYEEIDLREPGPGEVLLTQTAIGLNFADTYQREGEAGPHDAGNLPIVLGGQGAGVIEAVGSGVSGFKAGDRVAYIHPGAYAARRVVPADKLLHLPDGISDQVAAATLLRGLTAEYLVRRLYPVKPGDTALVHAAAGGMGLLLGQWAKALGARVIGTVGADSKVEIAKAHGCSEVIVYSREDFAARTMELTDGVGVDVIYDGVGKVGVPEVARLHQADGDGDQLRHRVRQCRRLRPAIAASQIDHRDPADAAHLDRQAQRL